MSARGVQGVAVLGSTGSIGCSTLDVIERHPDRFKLAVLAANRSWEKMVEQAVAHRPQLIVLMDEQAAVLARSALAARGIEIPIQSGADALAAAPISTASRMRSRRSQPGLRASRSG